MERFYVSATLVVVYLFPSLSPVPNKLSPGNFHLGGDSSPDLGMTLSSCISCHFFFFFLKEEWPTSNASGASPKPSLTPHRLTSTLTTNKTSFFSVNKLGSCLFSIFQKCLEAFSSLGFLLIFLTEPTLTFCLFSKLGNTNSFPEAIAWGKDFGLLQLSPALQRAH